MNIGDIIQNLLADNVTAVTIYGLVLLYVVDFVTGVIRAWSDHSFDPAYLDVWARAKGARLTYILIVLIAGVVGPDFSALGLTVNPLTALGVAWAASSAVTELDSIKDNFDKNATNPLPDASS